METNRLNKEALLVRVTRSMWGGNYSDDSAANETITRKGGEAGNGKFTIFAIPKKELRPIANAGRACRAILYKYSLPWLDGGTRILPIESYFDFLKELNEAKSKFDKVVREFLAHYPELCSRTQAKQRLGGLADAIHFPSTEELQSSFAITCEFQPIPNSADFRAEIDEKELVKIRENMDDSLKSSMKTARKELWSKLLEKITNVAESLKDDEKSVTVQMKSLRSVIDIIPRFSFIEDKELENVRKEVKEKITSLTEDEVKNKDKRKKVKAEAQKIIDKMSQYKF